MAYNCEQRIDELERLLIANQDCVDNVVDAYLQLEAEVAELKAKLDRYGNLLNDYSVREFKEEAYENEIFELKSKLAAESWHDASELPTEEGDYIMGFFGEWCGKEGFHYIRNWFPSNSGSDIELDHTFEIFDKESTIEVIHNGYDVYGKRKYFWRKITLPEGK
jgi:hypothetical protein